MGIRAIPRKTLRAAEQVAEAVCEVGVLMTVVLRTYCAFIPGITFTRPVRSACWGDAETTLRVRMHSKWRFVAASMHMKVT